MFDKMKWQKDWRLRTGNAVTKRYEKTPQGFLMRAYRNMQSRVTGVQKEKAHLYKGKKILKRDEFYDWANNSPEFAKLFSSWCLNNYDRKLSPSVDRVDSSKGYALDNMEWVTHSENSRRASKKKT